MAKYMTDREIADMCSYPHNIFHYVDLGVAFEIDSGGNNFFGDEENYISQLERYKLKFGNQPKNVLKNCNNKKNEL